MRPVRLFSVICVATACCSVQLHAGRSEIDCVRPGALFAAPGTFSVLDLGPVRVWEAVSSEGTSLPLALMDCAKARGLELFIRSSPRDADKHAAFWFRSVCGPGEQPRRVSLDFSQGSAEALWFAYDVNGQLLDSAVTPASETPQTVELSHPDGILEVRVIGAEICVQGICWECTPEEPPDEDCLRPGSFFEVEGEHAVVNVNNEVVFWEPLDAEGQSTPLNILDCDVDGDLELFISVSLPESPDDEARPARAAFRTVCGDREPSSVTFRFRQGGTTATWTAYDRNGNIVDVVNSGVSGVVQEVTLVSPTEILEVVITGIRLCIEEICWDCEPVEIPTDRCVSAERFFSQPERTRETILLGPVRVAPAMIAPAERLELEVVDCDGDGNLDISVPWSEAGAVEQAALYFPPPVCGNAHPSSVEIRVSTHAGTAWFRAYDAAGNYLTTGSTGPSAVPLTVNLSHPAGIYRVDIVGAELCIHGICWGCDAAPQAPRFLRGDSDGDGSVTLGDGIFHLNFLFLGGPQPKCLDAADADDSGDLVLGDAIFTFNFLFLGGPPPVGGRACAEDPTRDLLDCMTHEPCE